MQVNALGPDAVFGASGFRAKVGESFEPRVLTRIGLAFAALVRDAGGTHVLIGRDTRPSGRMALSVLSGTLMACGLRVTDAGVAPTPTLLHAAAARGTDGCLVITASHNPAEWNGIEFALSGGRLLSDRERGKLRAYFDGDAAALARWDGQGSADVCDDACELHLQRILALEDVDVDRIRGRRARIVVDACNGAGSIISPELGERLGCDVVPLNCDPSGELRRPSEPSPAALESLRATVVARGADVGFAHDPDADRLVIVDEHGDVVPEEYTFAFVADVLLKRKVGPVVTTVVTGALIDDAASRYGAPVHRVPVGVAHVVEKMREVRAVVGGEATGGVVVPGTHATADGVAAIALVLSGMAVKSCTVSAWAATWDRYHLVKASVPHEASDPLESVLATLVKRHPDADVDRTDGLKFIWDDAWLVVRPSGTEPGVRIFAESANRERAQALVDDTVDQVAAMAMDSLT